MKYGTFLIVAGIINIVTIFSGLPTGWKKGIIVGVSLLIVFIGWIIHTIAKARAKRLAEKARMVEESISQETMDEIADEIAEDVSEQVEEEIDRL